METLKHLVSRVTGNYLSQAVQKNNFFINDIGENLPIEHNKEWVSSVVSGLVGTVLSHARDTCIRLTARKYGFIFVFEIHESGMINSYDLACDLQQVQSLAHKIGGNLSISIPRPQNTTIAFSFPNMPIAA